MCFGNWITWSFTAFIQKRIYIMRFIKLRITWIFQQFLLHFALCRFNKNLKVQEKDFFQDLWLNSNKNNKPALNLIHTFIDCTNVHSRIRIVSPCRSNLIRRAARNKRRKLKLMKPDWKAKANYSQRTVKIPTLSLLMIDIHIITIASIIFSINSYTRIIIIDASSSRT